ncbi:hypothetical protein ACEWY4_003831 [Coilia grayii]|uniref:DDE Tnp4 domain-containing protein n=1 Tax=Coilia grayii TaxID=363190 RepID=A0ABD1KSB9_9TELE
MRSINTGTACCQKLGRCRQCRAPITVAQYLLLSAWRSACASWLLEIPRSEHGCQCCEAGDQSDLGCPGGRIHCQRPQQRTGGALLRGSSVGGPSPNCLGSIDGKHVVIRATDNSGSLFYNYKGTYSVVLLAVVDAEYCFRVVDVGAYGRTSNGGVLANSNFGQKLQDGTLGLPQDALLPGAEHLGPQPFVFVADEAFPLRRNLLRPFPGRQSGSHRVFNYRLSHARLIVENTFGILTSQWRMYRGVIGISPLNVDACVKATCVLHNFLRRTTTTNTRTTPAPAGPPAADSDAAGLLPVTRVGSNNSTREAIRVKETFMSYFTNEGTVTWQPAV